MTSSLARTALCAFSTTPSSIFPHKSLRICPFPAVPFPACRKDTPGYRHPLLPLSCCLWPEDNAAASGTCGVCWRQTQKTRKDLPFFTVPILSREYGETREPVPGTMLHASSPGNHGSGEIVPEEEGENQRNMTARHCLTGLRIDKKGDPFPGNRPAKDPLLSAHQVSILRGLPEPSSSFPRPGPKSPRAGTSACRALPSCRGTPPPSWG